MVAKRIVPEFGKPITKELPKLVHAFPYKLGHERFFYCQNPYHLPMKSWTIQCSATVCLYCNPQHATSEGRFILKWLCPDTQRVFKKLVEGDLKAGRIPPPYEGDLDEIEEEEKTTDVSHRTTVTHQY